MHDMSPWGMAAAPGGNAVARFAVRGGIEEWRDKNYPLIQ
jgi:hypothetical protein